MEILFSLIVKFFQFIGFCPMSMLFAKVNAINVDHASAKKNNILLVFWSSVNLLLLLISGLLICIYYEEILDMFDNDGKINAVAKSGTIILAHLFIVAESLLTRSNQQNVWEYLILVDQCLDSIGGKSRLIRKKFYQCYSIKFIAFQLLAIGSELYILLGLEKNAEWTLYWYATIFSLTTIRSKHLQHILFVDMLTSRFEAIKVELDHIVLKSKDKMTSEVYAHLKQIKIAYGFLYEMCDNLESVCSLSQLTNLTQNFIQLSGDLYWMYLMLYRNKFSKLPGILLPFF